MEMDKLVNVPKVVYIIKHLPVLLFTSNFTLNKGIHY